MPFAEGPRGIPGGFEFLRERDFGQRKPQSVEILLRHPLAVHAAELLHLITEGELKAAALLPASGHEAGACGCADGRVRVEVGELHAFRCEAVDVGRGDVFATHAAEVAVAEVIGEDENDVWRSRAERSAESEEEADEAHGWVVVRCSRFSVSWNHAKA